MKPKIKFRLEVWDRTLIFHILEMDERFRSNNAEEQPRRFKAQNGVTIVSSFGPGLYYGGKEVYLRGITTECDNCAVSHSVRPTENAEEHKVKILDALKDWSENWEGFKDDACEKEPGVYEF